MLMVEELVEYAIVMVVGYYRLMLTFALVISTYIIEPPIDSIDHRQA